MFSESPCIKYEHSVGILLIISGLSDLLCYIDKQICENTAA